MLNPRFVAAIFSVGSVALAAGDACGQNYPNKPIRIVTSGLGGGNDFKARLIAQGLTGNLGQQVIIDNRPNVIPNEIVARAAPDGYTLLLNGNPMWTQPLLEKTSYDPVRDFSAITLVSTEPSILVAHPSLPVHTVKEVIALAKARPGELNYGSVGVGSSLHLAAELFKSMAGVKIEHISYKGVAQVLVDQFSGQVHLTFGTVSSMVPYLTSNKLKALAITSAQPYKLLPGLPTVAASLPGYEALQVVGIFAPAKTPAVILGQLNREIVKSLNLADTKEKFFSAKVEIIGSSPEELAATVKSEIAKMGKVIKDAGIRAD
jgi:tripartite-type tricarboxylate transporter receptor subunit TctC